MTYKHTGRLSLSEYVVPAGESVVHTSFDSSAPFTVAVHPALGASATVSITVSDPTRIHAGTARWAPAAVGANGVVTASTLVDSPAPLTGVRVESSGGETVVEVAQ